VLKYLIVAQRDGVRKKKKSNVHLSRMMIGIYYRYIHTPAGTKERLLTEKKSVSHTHTHRISLGCEAENAGYFAFLYTRIYQYIYSSSVPHAHALARICADMCSVYDVVFEKEKREVCQMRSCIYFFFADASTLASTWVTFPSMTTPFPSIKATRERPSQFL